MKSPHKNTQGAVQLCHIHCLCFIPTLSAPLWWWFWIWISACHYVCIWPTSQLTRPDVFEKHIIIYQQ